MASQSVAERLAKLTPDQRKTALGLLSSAEANALLHNWRGFLARPAQIAPDGDWDIWLVLAGRGFGKTETGAQWVKEQVEAGVKSIALVAETQKDLEEVMVARIVAVHAGLPESERPKVRYKPVRITWPNGAVALGYNGTEPNQLRGPEFECFVAGTMISTANGKKPIEEIRVGDMVWTREGLKQVEAWWSKPATVGTVRFSNGAELTGTADHPVLTKSHGWMKLSELKLGVEVCAEVALSGVAVAGTNTEAGIMNIVGRGPLAVQTGTRFIAQCIETLLGKFQKVLTFTTKTETRTTIARGIWKSSRVASTWRYIAKMTQYQGLTCQEGTLGRYAAIADAKCKENLSFQSMFARSVKANVQRLQEKLQRFASVAAKSFYHGKANFAPSVVSTWQEDGRAEVFNMQVQGKPEYYANGILVHNCAWLDELAKYRYSRETWDMLQFGMRKGKHPRQIVTTTPRPTELIKAIVAGKEGRVHITRGKTSDNAANLAAPFMQKIMDRYAGTRLGRQELDAEILGDLPGALWSLSSIDAYRMDHQPEMGRIIVAVDPAVTDTPESDEHGIIVAGRDNSQRGVVLEDASMTGGPRDWASRAVSLYRSYGADGIVVETNQGGDMVAHTIRTIDPNVKIIEVRASRGKHVRAEPIAALYEQGRIVHVGSFPQLENQMTQMTSTGYQGDGSPDRVDALVWAFTELFDGMIKPPADPSKYKFKARAGGWMA